VLVFSDAGKRFGAVQALAGCSFSVARGRMVGFLGPNGAGKTTAMRAIFGLVRLDAGAVFWDGRPTGIVERLRFGYMPEERGLYPRMPVREQIEYFGRLHGLDTRAARAAASRWLERLGLGDRQDAKVEELSHGNQQRAQLAAALLHEPDLLVLDEPFAGLDPLGVEALGTVIAELAAAGAAVLFSSHQLDLVEHVCQDVVVLDHGSVVMAGELAALRAGSGRRYLDVVFRGPGCWTPALPGARVLTADPGHTRLELAGELDLAALAAEASQARDVTRFSLEPPALSDLFHAAVGR